jgi:hypothetical protein
MDLIVYCPICYCDMSKSAIFLGKTSNNDIQSYVCSGNIQLSERYKSHNVIYIFKNINTKITEKICFDKIFYSENQFKKVLSLKAFW